jgi:hypothetical protein
MVEFLPSKDLGSIPRITQKNSIPQNTSKKLNLVDNKYLERNKLGETQILI